MTSARALVSVIGVATTVRTAMAFVIASPIVRTISGAVGHHPDGPAVLFEPGGERLVDWGVSLRGAQDALVTSEIVIALGCALAWAPCLAVVVAASARPTGVTALPKTPLGTLEAVGRWVRIGGEALGDYILVWGGRLALWALLTAAVVGIATMIGTSIPAVGGVAALLLGLLTLVVADVARVFVVRRGLGSSGGSSSFLGSFGDAFWLLSRTPGKLFLSGVIWNMLAWTFASVAPLLIWRLAVRGAAGPLLLVAVWLANLVHLLLRVGWFRYVHRRAHYAFLGHPN